jgi:hypothetical protein
MPRKVTPRTSHGVEPDGQPPKYGLRKRIAHEIGDARHQTLAIRTKRTPTNICAQLPFSRGSGSKRMGVSSGKRWANKYRNKLWLAEAILKENDTQYLIEYAPVYEGAQREISWQPKHYANAALARDWKERNMANVHENSNAERDNDPASTKNEDRAGRRGSLMAYGGQLQSPITDHQSLEQYGTESEKGQQYSDDPIAKRIPGSFEERSQNTQLKATSPSIPEILDTLVPERNVPVAHMYKSAALKNRGAAYARRDVDYGRNLPAAMEDNHRCDGSQPRHDMAQEVRSSETQPISPKVASSAVQAHLVTSVSSQQLPTNGIEELESFLVEAATKCVSQKSEEKTSASDIYVVQLNYHSRVEGSRQNQDCHVTKIGGQGKLPPRPGTRISTLLLPAPSTLSNDNNQDHRAGSPAGTDSGQASPRESALVEVSENRNSGVPSTVSGKLASARERLRSLLRGPGGRRFRRSSLRFPPSP